MKKPFIAFYSQEGQNGHVDLRAIAAGKKCLGDLLLVSLLSSVVLPDP